ncbi:MAG: trypsin-like peptidase domain-containing protein [Clostridia bacterium]|nr:trypsin-like peptidase domain-containing protein [Clostridia bacterium]
MSEDFYSGPDKDEKENGDGTSANASSSVEFGPDTFYQATKSARKKQKGKTIAIVLSLCLAFSVLFGAFGYGIGKVVSDRLQETPPAGDATGGSTGNQTPATGGNTVIMNQTDATAATLEEGTVTAVVNKSAASVVEIMITAYSYGSATETVSGAGSGVIIAEDQTGTKTYIVTNNHVVEGNYSEIYVRTNAGKQYTAKIVATDWQSDIAVLEIEASGMTKATWANSDLLLQGQDVVVIGNPLGALGGSVSRGVLSGVERTLTIEGVPMKLLQIDAAVNPGNSGGGLFDMNGNLIGIVNAKSVGTNIEGLGYAIPSNYARQMVSELLEKGYVAGRVDLGLIFRETTTTGGLVISSYAYNESSTTTIQSGDVLVGIEIDGEQIVISSLSDYRGVLAQLSVGDSVKATIGHVKQFGFYQQTQYYTVTLTAREVTP